MDIENKIERLLSLEQGYIITPYEKRYERNSRFDEYEEYLKKDFLNIYNKKITKIILSLLCDLEVYTEITEISEGHRLKEKYKEIEYTDITKYCFNKLSEIIADFVVNGVSSMNIYFYNYDTLIVIEEGFSTCILGDNYDFIKMVKYKAEYESLYFRKI